jgi:hypothetical protein
MAFTNATGKQGITLKVKGLAAISSGNSGVSK